MRSKWWLALALICFLPATLTADHGHKNKGCDNGWWNWDRDCKQQPTPTHSMPEGGSSAAYVLGAGLTCLGAMFVRSRFSKVSD